MVLRMILEGYLDFALSSLTNSTNVSILPNNSKVKMDDFKRPHLISLFLGDPDRRLCLPDLLLGPSLDEVRPA
jgi:hypothetical protein